MVALSFAPLHPLALRARAARGRGPAPRWGGPGDPRRDLGYGGTYPADSRLLRIPIDHLLASCAIGVRDRRVGPDVGSDHLPVIVALVIPR